MRPLFIGQLQPFTARPIRASRLKNINLRKFTTFIMPYTSLSMPVVFTVKKYISRSRELSVSCLATPTGPSTRISAILPPAPQVLRSHCQRSFSVGPALISIYFLYRQRSHLLAQIPRKCKPLFVALPTPLPGHSWIMRATDPSKARGILHQAIILDVPSLTTLLNKENFDAPPSQMIPCIPFPADSFDRPYNISGFATVSVRPRQDRARGKIDRGNCVRDRSEKKCTVQYITSRHIEITLHCDEKRICAH
jgi:hypothetical protein